MITSNSRYPLYITGISGLFFLIWQDVSGKVFSQTSDSIHALGERHHCLSTVYEKTLPSTPASLKVKKIAGIPVYIMLISSWRQSVVINRRKAWLRPHLTVNYLSIKQKKSGIETGLSHQNLQVSPGLRQTNSCEQRSSTQCCPGDFDGTALGIEKKGIAK